MKLAAFVGTKGRGSNLMAIQSAILSGKLPAQLVAVIGTKADAPALDRARQAGIPTLVVPVGDGYDQRLLSALESAGADSIALTGYLRKLPEEVVTRFRWRILNVHPALLPSFGGKGMYGHHVHEAVIAHGCKVSGCTVHFVDSEYDTGPIIIQRVVTVEESETPESLAARILPAAHDALLEALRLLAWGRLTLDGRRVRISASVPL